MESLRKSKDEANATAREALRKLREAKEMAEEARVEGVNASALLKKSERNLTVAKQVSKTF